MEICRRNNEIEISELDPFLAELLRQIPASTDPEGISAAERRLFSPPADPSETEICAEWKLYVKPELRRLFQTATETVAADLEQLRGNEKAFANRTLLAAKYDFTDGELCDHYRSPIGSRRDLSLFQVNFYGFLQEFILRELDGWDKGPEG